MGDSVRNLGRLMVAWRGLLLVCVALELVKGSPFYSAMAKGLKVDPAAKLLLADASMSSGVVVGVLVMWYVAAAALQLLLPPTKVAIPVAALDLVVGLLVTLTQKTLFGAMLLTMPVLVLYTSSFAMGTIAGVLLLLAYPVFAVLRTGDGSIVMHPALLWYYAFMGLTVAAGCIYDAYRTQEAQARNLVTVIETSQQLGTSASREKILSLVIAGVKGLFGCNSCVIYLKDQDKTGEPVLRVAESSTAFPDAFTDFGPNSKNSVVGTVVKDKKGTLIGDFGDYQPEEVVRKEKAIRSVMVAPLMFEDEALGAIFVAAGNPNQYSQTQFHLFNMLTTQVAMAVRNMQLHEATTTLAITDSLSGLYTHGYFQEHLGEEIIASKKSSTVLSLMILDVDFFKKVNDTYGHPQGDSLLKQLGGLIRELTRPTDILCRYGGDEFTVTMLNTNRISAVVIAERIREAVESYEFVLGSQIVHITVSGGVASFPEDAETKKELIEKSDHAMYQAKQRGRNRVIFSS